MMLTVCVLYNLWTLIVRQSFPELQVRLILLLRFIPVSLSLRPFARLSFHFHIHCDFHFAFSLEGPLFVLCVSQHPFVITRKGFCVGNDSCWPTVLPPESIGRGESIPGFTCVWVTWPTKLSAFLSVCSWSLPCNDSIIRHAVGLEQMFVYGPVSCVSGRVGRLAGVCHQIREQRGRGRSVDFDL